MKLIPSRLQFKKWSLPNKTGYVAAVIAVIISPFTVYSVFVTIFPVSDKPERPVVSVLKLNSFLTEDSMETEFLIKNTGKIPAYLLITHEGFKGSETIKPAERQFESQPLMLSPEQVIKYHGLRIKGETYKKLLSGSVITPILQTITIYYGKAENEIGEYYVFQKAKLNTTEMVNLEKEAQKSGSYWLVEEAKGS